jgi:hypothetical protein
MLFLNIFKNNRCEQSTGSKHEDNSSERNLPQFQFD